MSGIMRAPIETTSFSIPAPASRAYGACILVAGGGGATYIAASYDAQGKWWVPDSTKVIAFSDENGVISFTGYFSAEDRAAYIPGPGHA